MGYGVPGGGPRRCTACRSSVRRGGRGSHGHGRTTSRASGTRPAPPRTRHQARRPGTSAAARRSSDHTAASPRRSHQVSSSAATTCAAPACGVTVCAWDMLMPCMTIVGCGATASKARCSPPCATSVAAPMAPRDRSRPPSRHPAAKTGANPAACTHTGGVVPVASACPPAASSTHSAANTAARSPRTGADAVMAPDPVTRPAESTGRVPEPAAAGRESAGRCPARGPRRRSAGSNGLRGKGSSGGSVCCPS